MLVQALAQGLGSCSVVVQCVEWPALVVAGRADVKQPVLVVLGRADVKEPGPVERILEPAAGNGLVSHLRRTA